MKPSAGADAVAFPSIAALEGELARRVARGRGEALHLLILHDTWCPAPIGPCSCSPSYVLEPLTVASYERGQEAEAEQRRAVRRDALKRAWLTQRGRS